MPELPASLPGVDIASGLPRVAGNKKLYLKLLLQVAGDGPNVQEKLRVAFEAGDYTAVREVAHSLKGAAANLSITNVAKTAEQLELAAKAQDLPTMLAQADALAETLRQLAKALEELAP